MRSALQLRLALLLLGSLSCGGQNSTAPSTPPTTPPPTATTTLTTVSPGVPAPSPSGSPVPPATRSAATLSPRSDSIPTSAKDPSKSTPGTAHTASGAAPTNKAAVALTSTASMTAPQISANSETTSLSVHSKGPVLSTPSRSIWTSEETKAPPSKKPEETSFVPTVKSSIASTTHEGTTTTLGGGGSADKSPGSTVSANVATVSKSTVTTGPASSKPGPVMPAKLTTLGTPVKTEGTRVTGPPSGVVPHAEATSPKSSITTQAPPATPKPRDPSPDGGAGHASPAAQSKIVCENMMPPKDPAIILTLNTSQPCDSLEDSQLKKPLLSLLCTAVKSNFNQSRDDCTVKMASVADNPKKLVVIGVSVTTHSVDEELSDVLAVKRGELEKLGVSNLTYGDRPLDIDAEDRFGMPLIITIVCMAASLLLVAAIYGCCHQRLSHRKDQQRLTEELQTMENGYHDNPTLEVMETSSEMQEKKVNLNGELADSWIVPMDSLTKEDAEEEDTHL